MNDGRSLFAFVAKLIDFILPSCQSASIDEMETYNIHHIIRSLQLSFAVAKDLTSICHLCIVVARNSIGIMQLGFSYDACQLWLATAAAVFANVRGCIASIDSFYRLQLKLLRRITKGKNSPLIIDQMDDCIPRSSKGLPISNVINRHFNSLVCSSRSETTKHRDGIILFSVYHQF